MTLPQKILVIKLSALGDFLLALGAMEAIRKHHPQAHITLLTTRPFADMAGKSGYFDAVEVTHKAKVYEIGAWLKLARFLNGGFDTVYDLQMNDRTAFFRRLMRNRPDWRGDKRDNDRARHAFDNHRARLAAYGIDAGMPDLSWMRVDVSLLNLAAPYVLLVPGSAPQHPHKRWPANKYAALALKLMHRGFHVAVIGTSAERDVIGRIMKAAPAVTDLSGRTSFYDIATLAMGAAGAAGNDTGPTHLISLAGCPVTALFSGATDPDRCAPRGAAVTVIQSDDIADITVDDVLSSLQLRAAA